MGKKRSSKSTIGGNEVIIIKQYLLDRIINNPNKEIRNYDEQYESIFELVKSTIETGEGNSALLVGSQGSGKTLLMDKVLEDVIATNYNRENVTIVKLNGLIHTNDRLAIVEITREMQLENVVGDKVFGSFAENFEFLLNCMKTGNKKTSKPIVFVLDEFDLFCNHTNQTLLYNLFDVSQTPKVPVCVLGLTCRLDVSGLLEKRVKSRFSHRTIYLHGNNDDDSGNNRLDFLEELLSLPDKNDELEIRKKCVDDWNKNLKIVITNNLVKQAITFMLCTENDERVFRNYLTLLVSTLSKNHRKLEVEDFVETSKVFTQDDVILMLQGLSVLEMCLIVAIKHETTIHFEEPFYFRQVWNRYWHFATRSSELKSVEKPVIVKAFEHLKLLGLLIPVGVAIKVNKEHQMYKFGLTNEQILDALKIYKGMPLEVINWAQNDNML